MPEQSNKSAKNYKDLLLSTEAIIFICLCLGVFICITAALDNRLLLGVIFGLSIITVHSKHQAKAVEQQHRQQLIDHQILLESVQQNPTAFAVYDANDRLIAWNKAYESLYSKTFQQLINEQPRQIYYRDLVRCNASQKLSGDELDKYVETRVMAQRDPDGSTVDRMYPDSGWFRVSKFVTPSGGVAGFAIDINELKRHESELLEEIEQRRLLEIEILALANTDSLTGIYNRRFFMENAEQAFNSAQHSDTPLIALMIDIDHFKSINDAYGHSIGDDVIHFVAKAGAEVTEVGEGIIGRLGGEEFAVTISGCTLTDGIAHAERFRKIVNNETFTAPAESFKISISIGLAAQEPTDHSLANLLHRADEALYQAKTDGRNMVACHTDDKAA